jgi:hypothetical protein
MEVYLLIPVLSALLHHDEGTAPVAALGMEILVEHHLPSRIGGNSV